MLAQVIVRWALHGESLEEAVEAPRFHLEGTDLHVEEPLPSAVDADLRGRGYGTIVTETRPYYFGSVQALEIDHERGEVTGAADPRRAADWAAAQR